MRCCARGVAASALVDLDGSFAFRGLPPGRYHLTFERDTESAAGEQVRLEGALDGVEAGRLDARVPITITSSR